MPQPTPKLDDNPLLLAKISRNRHFEKWWEQDGKSLVSLTRRELAELSFLYGYVVAMGKCNLTTRKAMDQTDRLMDMVKRYQTMNDELSKEWLKDKIKEDTPPVKKAKAKPEKE